MVKITKHDFSIYIGDPELILKETIDDVKVEYRNKESDIIIPLSRPTGRGTHTVPYVSFPVHRLDSYIKRISLTSDDLIDYIYDIIDLYGSVSDGFPDKFISVQGLRIYRSPNIGYKTIYVSQGSISDTRIISENLNFDRISNMTIHNFKVLKHESDQENVSLDISMNVTGIRIYHRPLGFTSPFRSEQSQPVYSIFFNDDRLSPVDATYVDLSNISEICASSDGSVDIALYKESIGDFTYFRNKDDTFRIVIGKYSLVGIMNAFLVTYGITVSTSDLSIPESENKEITEEHIVNTLIDKYLKAIS